MSVPQRPDESQYINSLTNDEKQMLELYAELESSKDEKKLISLVESGQLRPADTNKEGQTPIMFAIDSNFSTETVEKLIELGCDVNV